MKRGKGVSGGVVEVMGKAKSGKRIIAKVGLRMGKMPGGLGKRWMGLWKLGGGMCKVGWVVGGGVVRNVGGGGVVGENGVV